MGLLDSSPRTGKEMNISLIKLLNELEYPKDAPRDFIGASSIGSDCLRQIWYELKNEKGNDVPNRTRRTWKVGKVLEGMVIDLLRDCGINISTCQGEFVHPGLSYFKGHCDGVLVDYGTILEIKTAKSASFNIFVKKGLKAWSRKYYAQLHAYMGMSGIHKAVILVFNKDTSDFHEEFVEFDDFYFEELTDKAIKVYESMEAPRRIHNSPLWFECRLCKFNKECHV